ncbi:imidazole glycerol phosphate synthase subunit HisH [Nocardiopsis sp. TSRI0078]|uniref:imidazole glycerol phosphate synthase subunit HisH n=1 Tax=unclassified Nocardiopsis TaxID=2649073 RepID=UPI0009395096|nr:imidazole glycerol phosphate synthase subunit HisH [Nocardiopsis sp. TSRI0078]OKI15840.1 imidazole glycerol phosphate synthase subunit HisH [Nocardiopsis sp. TSRI0078]
MASRVVVFDYGSGNLRSAQRAMERTGADVTVTSDPHAALDADGLLVPGVGAFSACMSSLRAAGGDRIIGRRVAGGRPVLGICVGMQVLFDKGVESADPGAEAGTEVTEGCGEWPGTVERLRAPIVPHMGWNTVRPPEDTRLFAGIDPADRFYFVHSYAVRDWEFVSANERIAPPKVTWAEHGEPFVAAVENGPLWATQFHPEKSGDAGARILANWVDTL